MRRQVVGPGHPLHTKPGLVRLRVAALPMRAVHTMGATDSRKVVHALLSTTAAGRIALPIRVAADGRRRLKACLEQLFGQTRKLPGAMGKQRRDPTHPRFHAPGRDLFTSTAKPRLPSPFPPQLNEHNTQLLQLLIIHRRLPHLGYAAHNHAGHTSLEIAARFITEWKG